mmetsp:Transcript_25644/g.75213  ORF Transcript_25644/g.75213 Transcript_25644/m.75213 type:complete len:102 (-) Transcript_25644:622-927(-)
MRVRMRTRAFACVLCNSSSRRMTASNPSSVSITCGNGLPSVGARGTLQKELLVVFMQRLQRTTKDDILFHKSQFHPIMEVAPSLKKTGMHPFTRSSTIDFL